VLEEHTHTHTHTHTQHHVTQHEPGDKGRESSAATGAAEASGAAAAARTGRAGGAAEVSSEAEDGGGVPGERLPPAAARACRDSSVTGWSSPKVWNRWGGRGEVLNQQSGWCWRRRQASTRWKREDWLTPLPQGREPKLTVATTQKIGASAVGQATRTRPEKPYPQDGGVVCGVYFSRQQRYGTAAVTEKNISDPVR